MKIAAKKSKFKLQLNEIDAAISMFLKKLKKALDKIEVKYDKKISEMISPRTNLEEIGFIEDSGSGNTFFGTQMLLFVLLIAIRIF